MKIFPLIVKEETYVPPYAALVGIMQQEAVQRAMLDKHIIMSQGDQEQLRVDPMTIAELTQKCKDLGTEPTAIPLTTDEKNYMVSFIPYSFLIAPGSIVENKLYVLNMGPVELHLKTGDRIGVGISWQM